MPKSKQSNLAIIEIIVAVTAISLVSMILTPQYLSLKKRKYLANTAKNLQNLPTNLQNQVSHNVDRNWYGMTISVTNTLTALRNNNPTRCSIYRNKQDSCSPTNLTQKTTTLPTAITTISIKITEQSGIPKIITTKGKKTYTTPNPSTFT